MITGALFEVFQLGLGKLLLLGVNDEEETDGIKVVLLLLFSVFETEVDNAGGVYALAKGGLAGLLLLLLLMAKGFGKVLEEDAEVDELFELGVNVLIVEAVDDDDDDIVVLDGGGEKVLAILDTLAVGRFSVGFLFIAPGVGFAVVNEAAGPTVGPAMGRFAPAPLRIASIVIGILLLPAKNFLVLEEEAATEGITAFDK